MEDMNSFIGYFPGGHYKQMREAGESSKEMNKPMDDLDKLIEGSGLDVALLAEETRLWHDGVKKVIELTRKGATLEEVTHIGLELERHCNITQEMIYPFFSENA